MKAAVIDLGTNTFHLLIAEITDNQPFQVLFDEKRPAKIGQGGISQGIIAEEAFRRGLEMVKDFQLKTQEMGVDGKNIYATGTSAIRNASNGKDFVSEIFGQTGIIVEIIDGDREAELIYRGVRAAMPLGKEPVLIMDIGGGSVEFVIGNDEKIFWKRSFEIGGQRLMDKFMPQDPIPQANVKQLYDFLDGELLSLTNAFHQYSPKKLIGSSGTFDTFAEIYFRQEEPDFQLSRQKVHEIPMADFYFIYQSLLYLNHEERVQIPGMAAFRADMIVVACCLVHFIIRKYDIQQLFTSTYALKEGVLLSKMRTIQMV
jgi:exopolyphosphatase / guanosine-5'-triphosphate,3'-diphosphate pyrophosphatase